MPTYQIDVPEGVPAAIEVTCTDHGVSESFERSRRRLPFYCPACETAVDVSLQDESDWRPLTERC